MTPVALWTGRLPGFRPLPKRRTLWLVGGFTALGAAGGFGLLGPTGPWLGLAASLVAAATVWRHRWPTELPLRLRPPERPQGPDERAVRVEFRHEGALLGWDVGILWFERGGVGFVGRTVSFVLPRAMMQAVAAPATLQAALRAPQMTARVFETEVGIVPLARALNAHMTLARLDALPDAVTSETILPPSSMHPDLLQRGLAVRRRLPMLMAVLGLGAVPIYLPAAFGFPEPGHVFGIIRAFMMLGYVLMGGFGFAPLPASVRDRLPKGPRRNSL